MAQIFVSHSAKDKYIVDFFSNAFAGTKVKAVFEEFEKILTGKITPSKVITDIESSNAIFVILSQNVQNIPHTRDWVVWETGTAKNKDIWLFEPYLQFGRISVVIPYLRHHVIFSINNPWLGYIRRIIESYDDSHTLPTVLITSLMSAGIGAALAEKNKTGGAVLGGIGGTIAGLAMSDKSKERPVGLNVVCANCHSSYNIHIPDGLNRLRCPICNTLLEIKI
jgi:hypothetical protein